MGVATRIRHDVVVGHTIFMDADINTENNARTR